MNAMLMGVLVVGAALVTLVRLLLQHQLTLELREQGLHARGEVTHVRRSWLNARHRIVEYVFPLPDGGEIRGEYTEHRNGLLSQRASEGDSLEFLYLPDNPHRHQRVGAEVGLFTVLTGVFGLVVVMALAILLVMNAPSKQAPAPHRPTPAGRLRTYDGPTPRAQPLPPTREKRQAGASQFGP
ncbi:DUF3592 domain-containing protein [Corallococcus caeni]|uniref:DUF3592 domain-containing protein n=1 Tax=Corallococcus caeni TaxID=3082388 RepID=A0ABQ6QU50_9BACT|nr:hypothetical protein ASNO1_37930 [Corallococcus sp. NO1]